MSLERKQLFGESYSLEEKAIERLKTFEPADGYYVAFSGGKDSIVIYDLVKRSGVKHDVHFNVTSVDPPELLKFIRKNYNDVIWHRPEKNMWQLIKEKMMPPTRVVRYCCEYLKERGGKGRTIVTGVRWAESSKRAKRKSLEFCFKDKTKRYANIIIEWSDADVWEYIRARNLPYCELYDQGFKRIGCVGCPMVGKRRLIEFERWPRYEALYKKAIHAAAQHRCERISNGEDHLKNTSTGADWTDGDYLFKWWMEERREKENPDQGILFE